MYEQQRKTSRIDSVSASTETETPVYALGNSRWNYPRNSAADSEAICASKEKSTIIPVLSKNADANATKVC